MSERLLLWCGIALVALGGGVGVLAVVSDAQDDGPAPRLAGPLMPAGLRAANFRLTDQDGHPFALASTRGRVVVLTFLHSKCTSTCPVTLQTIRGALDNLADAGMDPGDVDVLALTADPEEDSPRSVRRFLRLQRTPFVRYLVAPRARMRPVWKSYAVAPQGHGKQEEHTAFVFLIDRRGIERVGFPSTGMTPKDLTNDLGVLLAEDAG